MSLQRLRKKFCLKSKVSPTEKVSLPKKVLTLTSKDGNEFVVEESVAFQAKTVKYMVEDHGAPTTIPLPNVDSRTLVMVLKYLNHHADSSYSDEAQNKFDKKFFKRNKDELKSLLLAANYLNIPMLLKSDLLFQGIADAIENMPMEELHEYLGIVKDDPEEENKLREESVWAFE